MTSPHLAYVITLRHRESSQRLLLDELQAECGVEEVLRKWLTDKDYRFPFDVESVNQYTFSNWGDVWEARRMFTRITEGSCSQSVRLTLFVADVELLVGIQSSSPPALPLLPKFKHPNSALSVPKRQRND